VVGVVLVVRGRLVIGTRFMAEETRRAECRQPCLGQIARRQHRPECQLGDERQRGGKEAAGAQEVLEAVRQPSRHGGDASTPGSLGESGSWVA
jgi:hypothetical protein